MNFTTKTLKHILHVILDRFITRIIYTYLSWAMPIIADNTGVSEKKLLELLGIDQRDISDIRATLKKEVSRS